MKSGKENGHDKMSDGQSSDRSGLSHRACTSSSNSLSSSILCSSLLVSAPHHLRRLLVSIQHLLILLLSLGVCFAVFLLHVHVLFAKDTIVQRQVELVSDAEAHLTRVTREALQVIVVVSCTHHELKGRDRLATR